jgi:DNA polymerase III alpha subunit
MMNMLRQKKVLIVSNILNDDAHEITQETFGFLIFQEQIALLAHKLGGLTLDEGNMLRKVLTKKGTGKGSVKGKLHDKFITGLRRSNKIGKR